MLRQSQYLSGDSFKPSKITKSLEKSPSNIDNTLRSASVFKNQNQNNIEKRFLEIKKKYGIKEKTTTEPNQINNTLKDITLRNSNYHGSKNSENIDKRTNPTASKSIIVCSTNTREYKKVEPSEKSQIKESLIEIVDQSRSIPRFGGRNTRQDGENISKSIEILTNQGKQQRVGSIDKINMKIYQILNCLNENTIGKQFDKSKLETQPKNQSLPKTQNSQKVFKHQTVKSKVYLQTNEDAFSKYYVPGRASRRTEPLQENSRRYSVNHTTETHRMKSSYLPQNSRIDDFGLKNKNIDQQIKRIDQRIKKSNQHKKEMNIDLLEWKNVKLPNRLSEYIKTSEPPSTFLERKNRAYGNGTSYKLKTQGNMRIPITQYKNTEKVEQKEKYFNHGMEMSKISSKVSILQEVQISKTQTKKLIDSLKRQVDLDEALRNAKVLASYTSIKDKWSRAKQLLDKKNIFLSLQQVQSELEVTLEEHNPFFSVGESNQSIDELIEKYVESSSHWTRNLKGKFNFDQLKSQGFCADKFDLQKKGTISIEDVVRFLNFQTKCFYRNRDIVLLYRRLGKGSSIRFDDLVQTLCI